MENEYSNILTSQPIYMFDQLYESVVITTPRLDGDHPKIIYANDSFCRVTGYSKDEVIGLTPRILQGRRTDRALLDRLKEDLQNGEHFEGEIFNYKKDGSEYRIVWSINPIFNDSRELIAYISFQKDISKEYYYAKRLEIFQKVIDDSSVHIALIDQDLKFFYANSSFLERTGFAKDEIIGSKPELLKSGNHDDRFYKKLYGELEDFHSFKAVFNNKNANGNLYQELQTIDAIYDGQDIVGYSIIGNSYDDEIKKQSLLIDNSNKDELTKVFNRKYFDEIVVKFIDEYNTKSLPFCMFFGDLDNFKVVNDSFGHDMGDVVLREVGKLLTETLRKSDYIFRYGGDEFIWLISNINYDKAIDIKEIINSAFANNNILKKYGVGISIGISEYQGEDIKDFFRDTDKQMYKQKLLNKTSIT